MRSVVVNVGVYFYRWEYMSRMRRALLVRRGVDSMSLEPTWQGQ